MVLNVETGHTSPSDYFHAVAVRDKSGTSVMHRPKWNGEAEPVPNDRGKNSKQKKAEQAEREEKQKAEQTNTETVSTTNSDVAGIAERQQ